MECYYRNSRGITVSFSAWPLMLQDPESLFRVVRKYTVGSGKITKIYADTQELSFTVSAFADTVQDYADAMAALHACVQFDTTANTPGALYFNGSYLSCYCIAQQLDEWDMDDGAGEIKLTVVSASPVWLTDRVIGMPATITPGAATVEQIADYPFNGGENDFWCDLQSIVHTQNDGIEPCDFRLRVFGPATNPIVRIGGHPYGVTCSIETDEYLEIDSEAGTVYQVQSSGNRLNKFNSRDKTQSVFEKVSAGNVTITKNGQYAAEIVLRQKGTVPKWIL